ncbi:MAG TPA: Hsp20/alpha crystallin family protein [Burkholderiaceae bacterium]|jgi:HSP20 family protein|nr:Hsp20/alpha crystallin family protein [Burkholderiaceae bacterium]
MFALNTRPAASVAGSRDPFSLMDSLFSDWLSARPASALVSNARIEVSESNASYEVRAELPGATKDDISVEIEGVRVSITAKRDSQSEKKDGEKVLYSERTHESYARSFELPQAVDSETAVARFENGVLMLTLPKKNAPQSRKLAVQ